MKYQNAPDNFKTIVDLACKRKSISIKGKSNRKSLIHKLETCMNYIKQTKSTDFTSKILYDYLDFIVQESIMYKKIDQNQNISVYVDAACYQWKLNNNFNKNDDSNANQIFWSYIKDDLYQISVPIFEKMKLGSKLWQITMERITKA